MKISGKIKISCERSNTWTDIYVHVLMHDSQIKYLPWKMILSLLNEPMWMRRDNNNPKFVENIQFCCICRSHERTNVWTDIFVTFCYIFVRPCYIRSA